MIDRYTLPEMRAVWDERAKYRHWTQVELLAVEAWASLGVVPAQDLAAIKAGVRDVDPARVAEIERTTQHDVIAFLSALGEPMGDESRWLHYGMTSSDLLDTALALQLREAADLIIAKQRRLAEVLKRRALEFRDTVCVGRSHGVHAEPTTFGLKLAAFAFETARNLDRMINARDQAMVGTISGAVGTYASIDPAVEEYVCARLGLVPEDGPTQVVSRDRLAVFVLRGAITASGLEKIAVEVRHLQRTEVREVEEPFGEGQKGSSAMPHKRNPILCERISGLSRVIRGYTGPALENNVLWHERDISHSSVERMMLPDVTSVLDYMLHLTIKVVDGMRVFPERMRANLDATQGLVYSQAVLLALVEGGMKREDAYAAVQSAAMRTWEDGTPFREALLGAAGEHAVGGHIDGARLDELMDPQRYLANVSAVFKRLEALET